MKLHILISLYLILIVNVECYTYIQTYYAKNTYSAGATIGCQPELLVSFKKLPDETIDLTMFGLTIVKQVVYNNGTYMNIYVQISAGLLVGQKNLQAIVNGGTAFSLGIYTCAAPPTLNIGLSSKAKVFRYESEFTSTSNTIYIPLDDITLNMIVTTGYVSGPLSFRAFIYPKYMELKYSIVENPILTGDGSCVLSINNGYTTTQLIIPTTFSTQNGTKSNMQNYITTKTIDTISSSYIGENWKWFNYLKVIFEGNAFNLMYQPVQGSPNSTLFVSQLPIVTPFFTSKSFDFNYFQYNTPQNTTWAVQTLPNSFTPIGSITPSTITMDVENNMPFGAVVGTLMGKNYLTGTSGSLVIGSYTRDFPLYPYGISSGTCFSYSMTTTLLLPLYSSTVNMKQVLSIENFSIEFPYITTANDLDPPVLISTTATLLNSITSEFIFSVTASDEISGISKIIYNDIILTSENLVSGTIFNGVFETIIYPYQLNYGFKYAINIYDNAFNMFHFNLNLDTVGLDDPRFVGIISNRIARPYIISELFWDSPTPNKPGMNRTLSLKIASSAYPKLTINIPNYPKFPDNLYLKRNSTAGYYEITVYIPDGLYTQDIDYTLQVYPYTLSVSTLYSMFGESALLSVTNTNPQGADQFPPMISQYTLPSGTIQLSSGLNNVSIHLTIQDGINGFDGGNITFSSNLDPQGYTFNFDNTTMVSQDHYKFDLTFNIITQYCRAQVFDIKSIYLRDTMGYYSQYPSNGNTVMNPWYLMNANGSISQFTVNCPSSSVNDPNPPVLNNFIIKSSTTINMCGKESERSVTLELTVSDSESGLLTKNAPYVYFEGLNDILGFQSTFVSGQPSVLAPKTYQLTTTLPYSFGTYSTKTVDSNNITTLNNNGVIILSVYGIFDNAYTMKGYSFGDLMNNGFNYYLNTTCTYQPVVDYVSPISEDGGFLYIYGKRLLSISSVSVSYDAVNFNLITVLQSGTILKVSTIPTRIPFTIRLKYGETNLDYVIYPTLNPTTPPVITNAPVKCFSDCGGPDRGECTPNGCVCKSSWIGVDCLSTVVFTDQPNVNTTNPTTQTVLASGDTVTYSSLVSVHSIREITPNGTVVFNQTFSQWILTDISSFGSTKYLYYVNFTKDSITTNITVVLEWFNSTKIIEFAGQNLTMNPSTMKYNVNITKYSFELGTNTLQVIFAASLQSSATEDTCSKKDFGDVPLSDLEYVKLKVNQNSLYGRFIKRGIIDQRVRSISNTLLDESGKPTESYQSQSMIAINVPHFFNNAMLDPDFSILVDSGDSDDTEDNSVNCTFSNNADKGLSRNQIIGIVVGSVVFALIIGLLGYYLLFYKFRYSKLAIILLKSRMKTSKVSN
ncbi:EGF-like domain-containing protein [Tieghemostelium lacteum]|uniref:EGF-like domain-containing protein n=1 Tax=Tieghemostelium lacteum TaxID=361077 RepID=A0A151Z937_TIELA|nr:EGF-like domain-containing protein [Tieghemostelium lacteum]|eukprot:KYQ90461.1 EGF-like domain-containing protein [Tieghemostelium lacteum]